MRYDVLLLNATTGWKLEAGGWRVCAHFRLCSAVDFDFAKLVRPMMLSSLTFATLLWTTVSVSAAFVPASAPSTTRLGVPFMRLMAVPVESRHQEANNAASKAAGAGALAVAGWVLAAQVAFAAPALGEQHPAATSQGTYKPMFVDCLRISSRL